MAVAWRGLVTIHGVKGRDCPSDPVKFSRLTLRVSAQKPLVVASVELSWPAMPVDAPPSGYRKNVGICLVSQSKKIFTASKIRVPDTWQMPQGGADEGEDLKNAAIRELREETGVTSAEFIAEVPNWLTYDFPREVRDKLNRKWGTNYRGQAQKWFLFKFTGKEEEINLLGDGTAKPEFKVWCWMLPEQVVELAVDFKRPVYEHVLKTFSPYFLLDDDDNSVSEVITNL